MTSTSQFYMFNIQIKNNFLHPTLAQLVERRTVVLTVILRSLVRIRQVGQYFVGFPINYAAFTLLCILFYNFVQHFHHVIYAYLHTLLFTVLHFTVLFRISVMLYKFFMFYTCIYFEVIHCGLLDMTTSLHMIVFSIMSTCDFCFVNPKKTWNL